MLESAMAKKFLDGFDKSGKQTAEAADVLVVRLQILSPKFCVAVE